MMQQSALELVNLVHRSALPALIGQLQAWGIRVYTIDGAGVDNGARFLAQATSDLGLPARAARGWDGFADDLWGALLTRPDEEVALVWTDAHQMLAGGLADLLLAVDVLSGLARNLYAAAGEDDGSMAHPVGLSLILVGEGANFPRLQPAGNAD